MSRSCKKVSEMNYEELLQQMDKDLDKKGYVDALVDMCINNFLRTATYLRKDVRKLSYKEVICGI